MSEKIAIKEVQGLEQSSGIVDLYEIALNADGSSKIYFTRGEDSDLGNVQMYDYDTNTQLNTYDALPIQIEGIETKSTGVAPRPVITFANVLDTFGNALGSLTPDDLVGFKLYRRRTLRKYLKDGSADTGSGVTPIEFPRQAWIIDRIEQRNALELSFELTTPFDVEGLVLPYRVVGHNACPWIYQGACPSKSEANKRGACTWHEESNYRIEGTTHTVYVNSDDEYVVASSTSFTTFSSSASADSYYKTSLTLGTASGVRRYNEDGTIDTSADGSTILNYWQAISSTDSTPADNSATWARIRVFDTYSSSANYYAYTDDRFNNYVTYTGSDSKVRLWKAIRTQTSGSNVAPGFNSYWERGDVCGKRLNSCTKRFGFISGSAKPGTVAQLPFGGFPGARKFK